MSYAGETLDVLRIQIKDKIPKLLDSQEKLIKETRIANQLKMIELGLELGTLNKEEAKIAFEQIKNEYEPQKRNGFFR